jgi:hypothetical protein
MKTKKITGADLIIGLFLIVTIPHTAFILMVFENKDWWLLAWSLAGAIDIGIAYGGVVSSNANADEEARQWATALFVGLSIGSYLLNVAHYVAYGAWLFSIGLGAFFPIGILLLAKIKSRLTNPVSPVAKPLPVPDNTQIELPKIEAVTMAELPTPSRDLSGLREKLVRLGKARLNEAKAEEEVDKLLAEWNEDAA